MSIAPVTGNHHISDYEYSMKNASKFVNAGDYEISKMASETYDTLYKESDNKFNKMTSGLLNSIPVLAVAAGLASKKGIKSSLIDGVSWGIALAAPKVVGKLNKAAAEESPKLKRAEKKHPAATFAGEVTASIAAFFGANALFNKAIASPKVKNAANNVTSRVQNVLGNIKNPIQLTPEASKNLADLGSHIKVPEFVKSAAKNISNSPTVSKFVRGTAEYGKKLIKNAPVIAVLGTAAAVIGKTISTGSRYSDIKSDIKKSQLETARDVIKSYDIENKMLREKCADAEKSEDYSVNDYMVAVDKFLAEHRNKSEGFLCK